METDVRQTRMHRNIIRVLRWGPLRTQCIIAGWSWYEPVWIPTRLFQFKPRPGEHFIGMVNTGARRASELVFGSLELAPEPDPDDGLN